MDWTKRRVLVTGASRGLGRALLLELSRRGATVVGIARESGPLEQVVQQAGPRASGIAADVGAERAAAEIAARVADLGGVDVVIHNASTLGPVPLVGLGDLDDRALEHVFAVNVLGPQRLTRTLLGPMRRAREGWVVGISSDAAVEAYPTWGAYGASKAALDHLLRVLAAELEGTGVRAFAVDPGEMDTQMHAAAIPDADPASLQSPADVANRILDGFGTIANGARVSAGEL